MKDNLVLTDAFLTDTAKRFDDVYLASLPTPEAHEYPADFYKKLAAVSEKRKKRKRYEEYKRRFEAELRQERERERRRRQEE